MLHARFFFFFLLLFRFLFGRMPEQEPCACHSDRQPDDYAQDDISHLDGFSRCGSFSTVFKDWNGRCNASSSWPSACCALIFNSSSTSSLLRNSSAAVSTSTRSAAPCLKDASSFESCWRCVSTIVSASLS